MVAEGLVPLVSIRSVTKKFGFVTAVRSLSLDIEAGDFLALFGPNGAGKSTLLQLIAQLTKPSQGEIRFSCGDGANASVGYVSHQSLLYNELTGMENLEFFARLYGLSDPAGLAAGALARIGLFEARNRFARNYSKGMKQRLTLARALLHDPQLLLLDEPYAGLDQHGSRLLTEILSGLQEAGRTVVLITHNLPEGLALASRLAIMRAGVLSFEARREAVDLGQFERLYFEVVETGVAPVGQVDGGAQVAASSLLPGDGA